MTIRVEVKGKLLAWARKRSNITPDELARRFPRLPQWERGDSSPTLHQLEHFAQATHTAVGFLLLDDPPIDRLPIPDFRTMGDIAMRRPSPDLLDTVYQCEQRQEWYRNFAEANREDPVLFVGSIPISRGPTSAAAAIREALDFAPERRGPTWSGALRLLAQSAESLGVLVMASGVVGSNTHRKLDPEEFRGFALADRLAPLVFVNAADSKAAQIFTLTHELAHIWVGASALSDADIGVTPTNDVERWCNQVAAEVLVPIDSLRIRFVVSAVLTEELDRLARIFKVSTLVVLRRIFEAGMLSDSRYHNEYRLERDRVMAHAAAERTGSGGGDFYNTLPIRISKRFAQAIIASTVEGQTLHRDAFQLLGLKKMETFDELSRRLHIT